MSEPEGLPPIPKNFRTSALDRNRLCPKCEGEGRVISNGAGTSVFCNPCKFSWPISSTPFDNKQSLTTPRGLSKTTTEESDWDMAYDDTIGGQSGPPRRR